MENGGKINEKTNKIFWFNDDFMQKWYGKKIQFNGFFN